MKRLAIVVPCYNEQQTLLDTIATLTQLLDEMKCQGTVATDSYLLFVNDGSTDLTWQILVEAATHSQYVCAVNLAHNVGQQNALLAGYATAHGHCDMMVSIDCDLQDDETKIPDMVRLYGEGCDVVHGVRASRKQDSFFKRNSAQLCYRFLGWLGMDSIYNCADYRLLSARAAKQLLRYGERNIYLRGIVPLLGYKSACVYFERKKRSAGQTHYSLGMMFNLAFDGITGFSVRPLRLISAFGLIFFFVSLCILLWVVFTYCCGNAVTGWSSLMFSIWFCTGSLLFSMGVVGEYVGKVFQEVKRRPRFCVEGKVGEMLKGKSQQKAE